MELTKEQLMQKLREEHGITEFKTEAQQVRDREYFEKKDKQDKRYFVWQNTINHLAVQYSLNPIQKGALLIMSTFLENNGDGKLFDTEGSTFTVNKIAELSGMSTRQAKRIIEECENIGALTIEKVGRNIEITFTDMLYSCGTLEKNKMDQFAKVFKLPIRELASKFSLKELGLLADLLPHFHKDSHILCDNPTWNGSEGMKVWRRKDIVEVTGHNKKFVSATITKFIRKGVMLETKSLIDVLYLHPDYVSRSDEKKILDTIKEVASGYANDSKVKYR
ncbi:hypothetical protein [Bacillus cereus group sp. Bce006]|uniref:hypothetical protein n=1 Tax=Bacillus cereus group sp. Bce006 TaxID=3445255 RepID=UPI003F27E797